MKATDLFDHQDHHTGQNKVVSCYVYIFAVLGFVCGADTKFISKDTRDEDSAKSGKSQDVTPQTSLVMQYIEPIHRAQNDTLEK